MPHFSSCCKGADEYICQVCGRIMCSGCKPSSWRPDITGHKSAGNVCPKCLTKHQDSTLGSMKLKGTITIERETYGS